MIRQGALCNEPSCWCHELTAVRRIPSTGDRYTVHEPEPGRFAYLYLPPAEPRRSA